MVKRHLIRFAPLYLLAAIATLFALYPFLFMIQTALRTQGEFLQGPLGLPLPPTFENLEFVLSAQFLRYFLNSIVVSTISVGAATLFGAMAAYPLALMKFRSNRVIYVAFIAGLMIPIHAIIIPVFVLTLQIGLYDSIWALVGPYIGFSLPITVLILTEFFRGLPREILEAASVDGAGHFRRFWSVLLPLAKPAVATVSIYNLIFIWNEFIFALTLTSSRSNATLPVGLRELFGQFGVNVPAVMMALTAASLPVLIFYFFAQDRVMQGLTAGAVK
ncbi:carbohydrate ABC transporter permease [Egibacter rhizosphaerae]|uniref:Carbohydrate ABC transporter permease n=1 Tax=Egibacter rhizosphaerae TaxID=1670831 RepID=A0A411YHA9_9ACTN|nr:carbohydrate ABC transporter permease [Egibacter rhizosphaerae]QBI20613.1 carbohydrate ABC transporter permease [Egibacter rhizosphaerae]